MDLCELADRWRTTLVGTNKERDELISRQVAAIDAAVVDLPNCVRGHGVPMRLHIPKIMDHMALSHLLRTKYGFKDPRFDNDRDGMYSLALGASNPPNHPWAVLYRSRQEEDEAAYLRDVLSREGKLGRTAIYMRVYHANNAKKLRAAGISVELDGNDATLRLRYPPPRTAGTENLFSPLVAGWSTALNREAPRRAADRVRQKAAIDAAVEKIRESTEEPDEPNPYFSCEVCVPRDDFCDILRVWGLRHVTVSEDGKKRYYVDVERNAHLDHTFVKLYNKKRDAHQHKHVMSEIQYAARNKLRHARFHDIGRLRPDLRARLMRAGFDVSWDDGCLSVTPTAHATD